MNRAFFSVEAGTLMTRPIIACKKQPIAERPNSLQTIMSVDCVVCRLYGLQTVWSTDCMVCRLYGRQNVWSLG